MAEKATVIPALRYRDAPEAIEWLCKAFGFEKRLVVPGEPGTIAHAQLVFGNGMIMLGSTRDDEFGRLLKPPSELGGVGSQSACVDIKDEGYGGRGYACRDLEGHLWYFGTYDPWAEG